MPPDMPLILTIVAGLVLAFILGGVANRLKMPPLVGYLVAGVIVGPHTPGFAADAAFAAQLTDIGLILLMFGVGLSFSLRDVVSLRLVALPGALVQVAGATAMGLGVALLLGWSVGAGLIFGLALSVASSVVLLGALRDRHIVESERGRIAISWLVVGNVAMVLALVLVPNLTSILGGNATALRDPFIGPIERLTGIALNFWVILAITVVKLAAFVGFMLVVGRSVVPWVLRTTARTGSRELSRLAVLALALGLAAGGAYLFNASLALGAFLAGMIIAESRLSRRVARETLPLREAFTMLFFLGLGMLFDPAILGSQPLALLATVLIVLVGKSVLAYLVGIAFRQSTTTALTIAASLAQIGEFSLVLAALGVGLGVLPPEGRDLIIAGALISIVLNPLSFRLAEGVRPRVEARASARTPGIVVPDRVEPGLTATSNRSPLPVSEPLDGPVLPTQLTAHTVLVGYGRVGNVVADGMLRQGKPFLVIENSETVIGAARAAGIEVVAGNAAMAHVLELANIAQADTLIVSISNAFEAGQVVEQSRNRNGALTIIARARSDDEVDYLRGLGANEVIMGEREIGLGILSWTNGDAAHEIAVEREQARFDAVAAALRLKDVPSPRPVTQSLPPEPVEPTFEPSPTPEPIMATEPAIAPTPQIAMAEPDVEPREPELEPEPFGEAEPEVPWPAEPDSEPQWLPEPEPSALTLEPVTAIAAVPEPLPFMVGGYLPPVEPVYEAPVHFEPPAIDETAAAEADFGGEPEFTTLPNEVAVAEPVAVVEAAPEPVADASAIAAVEGSVARPRMPLRPRPRAGAPSTTPGAPYTPQSTDFER